MPAASVEAAPVRYEGEALACDTVVVPDGRGAALARLLPAAMLVREAGETAAAAAPDEDLEGDLGRHIQSERLVDRELALGLARLWDGGVFWELGAVRAIDIVREYLGLKEGKARWRANLGRGLQAIPELDRCYLRGELGASQIAALLRILGPESDAEERQQWIARARGTPVRELTDAVDLELERRRQSASAEPGDGEERAGSGAAVAARGAGMVPDMPVDPDEVPAGRWISVSVPARLAVLWREGVELARKQSGRHAPIYECADWIAAELIAKVGDEPAEETRRYEEARRRENEAAVHIARLDQRQAERAALERGKAAAAGGAPGAWVPRLAIADGEAPCLPERMCIERATDPWQLARCLRRLAVYKQHLRLRIGMLLAEVRARRTWRQNGVRTYDQYCVERLGFTRRHAEKLLRFRREMLRFHYLRQAYRNGKITYTAALKLLRILHPSTEVGWVDYTMTVSFRELERVVDYALTYMLRDAEPRQLEAHARLCNAHRPNGEPIEKVLTVTEVLEAMAAAGVAPGDGGGEESANAFALGGASPVPATPDGNANAFAAGGAPPVPGAHDGNANVFAVGGEPPVPGASDGNANAFAASGGRVPIGYAMAPTRPGALPRIAGLSPDAVFTEPERCVAQVRFWAPHDVADHFERAMRRCAAVLHWRMTDPWRYLEVMLVLFIKQQHTPEAREIERRHQVLARDDFWCRVAGCMSRARLETHHIQYRSRGGTDNKWNLTATCRGHHRAIHRGQVVLGGWAPGQVIMKLGVNPKTGKALACYINEQRVPERTANRRLRRWRGWWRQRRRGRRRASLKLRPVRSASRASCSPRSHRRDRASHAGDRHVHDGG